MIRRLRAVLTYLTPGAGRFTPAQIAALGGALPSVGYVGVGPLLVLFNLPRSLQVEDPVPSVFAINAHLREVYASQGQTPPAWLPD